MCRTRSMFLAPLAAFLAVSAAGSGAVRADDARDFTAEAKLFYRVVACGGSDALPAGMDQAVVDRHRAAIDGLLTLHDSTSENMMKLEQGGIPGQLSFHMAGLRAMGYEPVSLKFFRFEDDGTIHYYSQADFDALASKKAKKLRPKWV